MTVGELPNDLDAGLSAAIARGDGLAVDALIEGATHLRAVAVPTLNALLIMPDHHQHQQIAFLLQKIGDPSSVASVCRALDQGFDYLAYTCSEDAVITKWFSWLLAGIGTPDAVAALERYARSDNPAVAQEMAYRLKRVRPK